MKRLLYFLVFALFIFCNANSVEKISLEWFKGYGGKGGDMFRFVGYDKAGNYYITGIIEKDSIYFGNGIGIDFTNINSGYFLLKFNSNDVCQWARTTKPVKYQECKIMPYNLSVDNEGNIVILSTWYRSDYQQVKGIDFGNGIVLDGKGHVDILLLKYDSKGNCIMGKTIGGKNFDSDYSMCLDKDNNIYISGYSNYGEVDFGNGITLKMDSSHTGHFAKYSKDGNCLWAKKLSHPNSNSGNSAGHIVICPNGTIILSGSFAVNTDLGDGKFVTFKNSGIYDYETFIANYSLDGNLNWVKVYENPQTNLFSKFAIKQNSEFYFTGTIKADTLLAPGFPLKLTGSSNFYLAKCDSKGDLLWAKSFGGDGTDDGFVYVDNQDRLYLYGYTISNTLDFGNNKIIQSDSGKAALFLAAIDDLGNVTALSTVKGIVKDDFTSLSDVNDLKRDGNGSFLMTGYFNGSVTDNKTTYTSSGNCDAFLVKFHSSCFAYTGLNSTSSLYYVRSAEEMNSFIRLTPSKPMNIGALWYNKRLPVKQGFATEFKFRMSDPDNSTDDGSLPGADGIAFVIQNEHSMISGSYGGGIGFEGIQNSLAIEFDTYKNVGDPYNDSDGNHVAVFCNGSKSNVPNHKLSANLGTTNNIMPLKADGTFYYAQVNYNYEKKILQIYLDTTGLFLTPVLEIDSLDISKLLNLENGTDAYVGFTSGTGTSYESHDILQWSFCPEIADPVLSVEDYKFVPYGEQFLINPNLVADFIEISVRAIHELPLQSIEIFSTLGLKVLESEWKEKIDVSGLPSGVYFVRIGDKASKFIKI